MGIPRGLGIYLTDEDFEMLTEFMNHQAGRTFDMRKPEHRVAHKILTEILIWEIPSRVSR